jgi:hypothetical protein
MHLIDKDKHGLKVKEGKQIFQANGAPKASRNSYPDILQSSHQTKIS